MTLEFRTDRVWEAADGIALVDMTADASDDAHKIIRFVGPH